VPIYRITHYRRNKKKISSSFSILNTLLLPPVAPVAPVALCTIRKYTFNIGYLRHSTSVLKPMLNVLLLTSVLKNRC